MSEPLAHSGGNSLAAHLHTVAAMAAEFSKPFDAANATQRWAYLAGLWHLANLLFDIERSCHDA